MFLLSRNPHAQKVDADWDHNVQNFSSFKTFELIKPVCSTGNPLTDQRIVSAIDGQKGFQQVENNPDVQVTYGTGCSVRGLRWLQARVVGGWAAGWG